MDSQESRGRVLEVLRWAAARDGYDLTITIWEVERRAGLQQEEALDVLFALRDQGVVEASNTREIAWRVIGPVPQR